MNTAPAGFHASFSNHNRNAFLASFGSLLGALASWLFIYFFFVLIALGLVTAARGEGAGSPAWIRPTAYAICGILLIWGTIDHIRRHYQPAPDRPIIGWHLFAEFLLLPTRMTLAIWGNLSATVWLSPREIDSAWDLLLQIREHGRTAPTEIGGSNADRKLAQRILTALTLVGYIDLHRLDDESFYLVRSDREEEIAGMIPPATPEDGSPG